MPDKLDIFSRVLVKLGQRPLLSLNDQRPEQRAVDRVYDSAVRYMIESALWKFASQSEQMFPAPGVWPRGGLNYAYQLPADYVRIIRISDNNRFRPTLVDFCIENGFIFCDCVPLYLQYVSNDIQHGFNLGIWPQSFADALVDELAVRTAPYLTSAGAPKLAELKIEAKRSFYISKARDAVNQPESWPPPGKLVRARSGWRRVNNQGRTPYI
jgi:hypothetical protein